MSVSRSTKLDSDRLKVMVISIASPPKGNPESLQVSRYLKYLSHKPLDIYLVTEQLPEASDGWVTFEKNYRHVLADVKQVIQIPTYRTIFYRIFSKIGIKYLPVLDEAFLFTLSAKKILRRFDGSPDIIYSRSTPFSSAVLAMKLSKIFNVPWIMHLSDPWVESPFFKIGGYNETFQRRVERTCFDLADRISFTSSEQIDMYRKKYPHYAAKFVWFPNVYDDESVNSHVRFKGKQLCFLHSGNFYGPGRSPEPILRALNYIRQKDMVSLKDVSFNFTGHKEPSIDNMFAKYPSIPAKHLGVLSLDQVQQLQRTSEVLIVIDWCLPKHQAVFLLSKIVDYMAARKPVLAITTKGSTIFNLVEGVYGKCFEHDDIAGIAEYIKLLINQIRDTGIAPNQLDARYSASKNADQLYQLISDLSRPTK